MDRIVRICFRCQEIMSDAFTLEPVPQDMYPENVKYRCDNCRKSDRPLVIYRVEPKRRAVRDERA